jgi:isoquinoline 1-oxidoreductase beta subunit
MDTIDRGSIGAVSRRGFLSGSAGLTFALSLPEFLVAKPEAAIAAADTEAKAIGAWVTIAADGAIGIANPASEMGQGSFTGLAMIFAEELDADWARVTPYTPPPIASIYGNPAFGGAIITVGSQSVRGYWDKIRLQAAAIRRVLMQAAADEWNAPLAELHTEPSVVVHGATNRRLSYGEIAAFATVPATLPTIDKSELKKTADYRIIGKTAPRFDLPGKVTGAALYAIDVQVPNMVYATVLRCPVDGAAPDHVDDSAALATPGILKVLPMKDAVGVVGESVEAVFAGRDALKVTWSSLAADSYSSVAGKKDFLARSAKLDDKGAAYVSQGDADAAFAKAAKVMSAQYTSEYVYHAQMEPLNVTASVNAAGDGAEIWVGTQGPTATIMTAAGFLKTKPENIKLHQFYLGGGFGRRSPADLVPDAMTLSQAMQRPVKLMWTREEDVKSAKMRPMTGHQLDAAFDASGNVTAWRHRLVAESVVAYRGGENALNAAKGLDNIVLEGAKHQYEVANQSIVYLREKRGVGLSAWRGIGAGYNKFAIETFIDELAAAQGADPVAFRLGLLKSDARARSVIKAVADRSGWGNPRTDGHALGFAFAQVVETYVAAVGEISLDPQTGVIRAHKFWIALDPGVVINPDSVLAQTEGNVIFGLSQTLKEQISVSDGRVDQNNFYDYPVLRMAEAPEIDIQILPTDNRPTGMGEAALPLVGPCVGNALFRLTGTRLRGLPMTPERVKAGLALT